MNLPPQSLRRRATVVIGTLCAVILADLVAVYGALLLVNFIQDLLQGLSASEARIDTIDDLAEAAARFHLLARLATAIAFLSWFYRAYQNLRRANVDHLKYSPGWAVGGFFVPILNFIRPYQVMDEVWRRSPRLADSPSPDDTWSEDRASAFVGLWWLALLLGLGVGRIGSTMMNNAEEVGQVLNATYVTLAARLVNIVAAAVTIALVRTVTNVQEAALPAWPAGSEVDV